jgi:hypothetical protein
VLDDEWDWDRHEVVDLDVTGDPQLDVYGYQSPKRRGGTGFTSTDGERLVRSRAQRERDAAKRKADRQEMRRRNALPPERPARRVTEGWSPRPVAWSPPQPTGPQPGQHGAYFERRVVRRWWAPWTKRTVWQQISAWQAGQPPAGATVVTVPDVAALPGRVHTIGRVSETGAVEW